MDTNWRKKVTIGLAWLCQDILAWAMDRQNQMDALSSKLARVECQPISDASLLELSGLLRRCSCAQCEVAALRESAAQLSISHPKHLNLEQCSLCYKACYSPSKDPLPCNSVAVSLQSYGRPPSPHVHEKNRKPVCQRVSQSVRNTIGWRGVLWQRKVVFLGFYRVYSRLVRIFERIMQYSNSLPIEL